MARLNKNNYPSWLFLLLSPFLLLRFFLIDQVEDPKKTARLYWLRALSYLGILIIQVNLVSLGDNPPKFEDAEVHTGVLVTVVTGKGSRRSGHAIHLQMENGEKIRFAGRFITENIPLIEKQIGKLITVWSYKRLNIFFFEENRFIELEIKGQRLKNSWPEVKKKIESRNPKPWLYLGLVIILWAFFHTWKLLTKH